MEETRAEKKKKKRFQQREWEEGERLCVYKATLQSPNAQTGNESDGGNNKRRGENVQKRPFHFYKRRRVRANVAKVKPPPTPLGIFLPFPGVPFARSQLDSSLSSSLFELLPLAVRGLASCASLRSCHIFFFLQPRSHPLFLGRGCSRFHPSARTHARTGTLPRRNMPHGQRISAAVGGKVQD